ncbi:MAG: response regulator [Oscillospiraceae bacterium]|nr:response regulator [Oscillospiraceae bacterium]
MKKVKILIADSSPVYTKMFKSAIEEVDDSTSIISVNDGNEAANIIVQKSPDIVIIDAEIKGKDLSELIKLVMRCNPKQFILVTARPSSTSAKVFVEALSAGASDCMTKPIYDSYNENFETVKNKMSDILGIQRTGNIEESQTNVLIKQSVDGLEKQSADNETGRHGADASDMHGSESKNRKAKSAVSGSKAKKSTPGKAFRPQIILIAVSTGGPRALETILPAINPDIPVPILVVQHMPPHFIGTLVERLNTKATINVKVAEDGEKLTGKTVYFAPGGVHMRLNSDNVVYLDDSPPLNGVRPAADALFESVAHTFKGIRILTVVLTGMGHDSLRGLVQLKEMKKCYSIAQSEKTCVVYGMPRAVVEAGLADKILDLDKIAAEINGFTYI